jgi:protein-disulfide isomerase
LQLATVLFSSWYTGFSFQAIGMGLVLSAVLAFFIPVIVLTLLLPAMRKAKESKRHKTELQRLKHNPQIFEALLEKQNPVTHNPEGLGITLGNPQGRFRIIKVCNPYCGPCAKAHTPIEELLHGNPDVQVRIIFTASGKEGDRLTPPVKHLLAIAEKGDEALTKKALDDWYLADSKDYDAFAAKHPMNGELDRQGQKLEAMRQWCTDMEITGTPTFYVSINQDNGGRRFYQLPDIYRVNDLNYFFSQ